MHSLPRALAALGVTVGVSACTATIDSAPISAFKDGPVSGVVYHLPKSAYTLTAEVRISNCTDPSKPTLSFNSLDVAHTIVADKSPEATFVIDAESFREFAKKIDKAEVKTADGGTLTQVNFNTDDQTGEIVSSAVGLVTQAAGIPTGTEVASEAADDGGSASDQTEDGAADKSLDGASCTERAQKLMAKRREGAAQLEELVSESESYAASMADTLGRTLDEIGEYETEETEVAQTRLNLMGKSYQKIKSLVATQEQRLDALDQQLTRTVTVQVDPDSQGKPQPIKLSRAVNLGDLVTPNGSDLYTVEFGGAQGPTMSDSGIDADDNAGGIYYRIPRKTSLTITPIAGATADTEVESVVVHRPFLQGGRIAHVPLTSQEFESGTIAVRFGHDGLITRYTYQHTGKAPGAQATGTVASALGDLIDTDAEKRAAELAELEDEVSIKEQEKNLLDLEKQMIDLEKRMEELRGENGAE